MQNDIGFIGVGDLAEYTIIGLRRGGFKGRILLSPRNRDMSAKLALEWQCKVMESNQAVIDSCQCFVLSTRPAHCLQALAELKLTPAHLLISVVAGVTIDSLREVCSNGIDIVRAMPVNCARAIASPTLVYPNNAFVNELFDYCGKAILTDDEDAFNQGNILACVYTWYFALFGELIKACTSESLSKEMASELVLGMAKGAAELSLQEKQHSPDEIAELIATDGTFSKLGLDLLKDQAAFKPWQQACQLLNEKFNSK